MTQRLLTCLFLVLMSSCATFASHEEASSYRALRRVSDSRERLVAMSSHVQRYPNSAWSNDLRQVLAGSEESLWAENDSSQEGLQYYLSVYPNGQYVEQAQRRLAAVGVVEERREVEAEHVEALETQREEDVTLARRQWVTRAMQFWTRNLITLRGFGGTISQVARSNPEFAQAFGQAPEPQCTPAECIKHYQAHFGVPNPGGSRIERDMHLYLRIVFQGRGRVQRIEVFMPDHGFSRWQELETRQLVLEEDPEQRQAAIDWGMAQVATVLAEVLRNGSESQVVPLRILAPGQVETGPAADTQTEIIAAPPTEGTEGSGGTTGSSELDDLLRQAVPEEAQAEGEATPQPEAQVADASSAGPIRIRASVVGGIRVVFFAASPEDPTGTDGFYIEAAN